MKRVLILTITLIFAIGISSINAQTTESFTDSRNGKTYKTVKIGDQVWMAENLAYKADAGCWAYGGNENNVSQYGYLYNYEIAKNVCPNGYHLPTKAEFETLLNNYSGRKPSKANYKALISNGKSGYAALFGGNRDRKGNYYFIGGFATFWSSSIEVDADAWLLYVDSLSKKANMSDYDQSYGSSVRCVRD